MPIAATLKTYLDRNNVDHEVLIHPRTFSSMDTAQSAHIKGRQLAKGVVVEDERGQKLLVVLPSSHHVDLEALHKRLGRRLHLTPESTLAKLFPDCRPGAIPALGAAYGLPTVWDAALAEEEEIFFEAGDHELTVRISGAQFRQLLAEAPRVYFT
ncbi:MAG TPA: YbaK/EbsC family protein [Candidatus Competibacteraceae bacterium]|nr:MAG: YbaK/EbsC family protein [Candidatus Competibacteraceae bacterium]HQC72308.1 YbaK/EbsC family protein [Candidatus Competibacteraceae bacterium]